MATSLAKRAHAIATARLRAHKHPVEDRALSALAGVGLAFIESKIPLSVLGIPSKAVITIAATAIEMQSKGRIKQAAEALGNASAAVYGYAALKTHTLIAGEEGTPGLNA
jgi:hypothetical protein